MKYFGTIVVEFEDDSVERAATRISEMGDYACDGLEGAYGAAARVVKTSASDFPMIAMTPERVAAVQAAVDYAGVYGGGIENRAAAVKLREILNEVRSWKSGIVLRRARCHAVNVEATPDEHFAAITTRACECPSYQEVT